MLFSKTLHIDKNYLSMEALSHDKEHNVNENNISSFALEQILKREWILVKI